MSGYMNGDYLCWEDLDYINEEADYEDELDAGFCDDPDCPCRLSDLDF